MPVMNLLNLLCGNKQAILCLPASGIEYACNENEGLSQLHKYIGTSAIYGSKNGTQIMVLNERWS